MTPEADMDLTLAQAADLAVIVQAAAVLVWVLRHF